MPLSSQQQQQHHHLRLWPMLDLAVVLLLTVASGASADVTLQFYLLQAEQWESKGMEAQFKAAIASGAATYCSTRLAACGLNASSDYNFTSASVFFTPGYPKNYNSKYMDLSIYVNCTPRTGRQTNLTAATLTAIIEMQRQEIYNLLGCYIVYIGETFYTIPPPSLVNWIVVPIAIIVTLVLIIVALALSRKHADPNCVKPAPIITASVDNHTNSTGDSVQPTVAAAVPRQSASDNKIHQKVKSPPTTTAAASHTAAALLPGATNEGFNQSASEKELRQRRTVAAIGEEMVLTDAAEFNP